MANQPKARAAQLIRTDDRTLNVVKFFDRREVDVNKAFIGEVDVTRIGCAEDEEIEVPAALSRAAIHGITQNIMDASNTLTGDERVAFIAKACVIVQQGGWASAPVDEAKATQKAIAALTALGMSLEQATKIATERA